MVSEAETHWLGDSPDSWPSQTTRDRADLRPQPSLWRSRAAGPDGATWINGSNSMGREPWKKQRDKHGSVGLTRGQHCRWRDELCLPDERPAANGHLLRTRRHPRRRSYPAAAPGHVATSRGALPGRSCCCRARSHRRRQHVRIGLAEAPSVSSDCLYVPMVKIC
jgi:hypothetical protein